MTGEDDPMTTTPHAGPATTPGPTGPDITELAARVDEAARRVAELDEPARRAAEELRQAVEAVHRAGLVTIVRRMRADEHARELLFALVDEPEVRMLLMLHGIIRPDPATETARVLAGLRPWLREQGADAELVAVEDGVAHVRLDGGGPACSGTTAVLRDTVERAIVDAVPAIHRVEYAPSRPAATFIPLTAIRAGRPDAADTPPAAEGWVRTMPVDQVPQGEVTPMRLAADGREVEVIVVRLADRITAYVNACAHQGLPLDAALVDAEDGTLTCPWHGLCYDARSGECLSLPGAALRPLPVRVAGGDLWIQATAAEGEAG